VRYVLSRSAVVRVESELWIEAFLSEFDLDGGKVCAIPNAVRPEEFGVNTARTHYPEKNVTLLFLGWVGEAKGIFDLLDSVELLAHRGHEFRLVVLGPEMRKGDMEKVRNVVADKALDGCTEILGERDRSEVIEAYHAADVYVLPSHTEGLPLSILEAMAAGLPVVSTRVGAIPGVIEEGVNGFLVSPGDVVGLASAIEALIKDGALRARMGRDNRLKIREEYSLAKHVERFKTLYWSLLRK
jgi:glycosyltransferase involved in cell wall biosynthesis